MSDYRLLCRQWAIVWGVVGLALLALGVAVKAGWM